MSLLTSGGKAAIALLMTRVIRIRQFMNPAMNMAVLGGGVGGGVAFQRMPVHGLTGDLVIKNISW